MPLTVDIEKTLGRFHLRVQLEAADEVTALLGASGCGKSLTLQCIAGLVKPDRGRIVLNGVPLFDSERHIDLPPGKRRCGLMFQNYALFPNMTVRKNIYTGVRRDPDRRHREEKVDAIMERFGLLQLQDHLPGQLSGGQQQRTALARILVSEPDILMLDEPFSALDSHLRFRMEQEVRRVTEQFGRTVLLVSHDRDEVFRLAQKIAVMHNGSVDVAGSREEVFAGPRTLNACLMTGCKNISPIRKLDDHHLMTLDWGLELKTAEPVGDASHIGIRQHAISPSDGAGDCNIFLCDVADVIENPFSYTVMLRAQGQPQAVHLGWDVQKSEWHRMSGDGSVREGQVYIRIAPQAIHLLRE